MQSKKDYRSEEPLAESVQSSSHGQRRSLFSGRTLLVMGLLLGAAIGFAVTTLQIHAGENTVTDPHGQVPSDASPASATQWQPPIGATYELLNRTNIPAANNATTVDQSAFGQAVANPAAQSVPGQCEQSTASGEFVNSQGIAYTRIYVPGPDYPVNPNWTVSRNGLIGNPCVDPPSSHGRAFSTPLN